MRTIRINGISPIATRERRTGAISVVRLPFGRLEPPNGYLGDERIEVIEVIDEDGVHGVAGMFGPLFDDYPIGLYHGSPAVVSCA